MTKRINKLLCALLAITPVLAAAEADHIHTYESGSTEEEIDYDNPSYAAEDNYSHRITYDTYIYPTCDICGQRPVGSSIAGDLWAAGDIGPDPDAVAVIAFYGLDGAAFDLDHDAGVIDPSAGIEKYLIPDFRRRSPGGVVFVEVGRSITRCSPAVGHPGAHIVKQLQKKPINESAAPGLALDIPAV